MPAPDCSQDDFIVTHYQHHSALHIAKQLGWTKSKVMRCIARLKLPPKINMDQRPYTNAELAYIDAHKDRISLAEIAAHLGRTEEGVRRKANRVGIEFRMDLYTLQEDAQIAAWFHTASYAEIGERLGRTQEAIRARAKLLGLTGDKTMIHPGAR